VLHVLNLIEYFGEEYDRAWVATVLIDIVMFLNLQFRHDELFSNFVITAVSQMQNMDTFKQKLLFYVSKRLVGKLSSPIVKSTYNRRLCDWLLVYVSLTMLFRQYR